ncbi:MAG: tripartite tricarboxylate transporter substrate binding protein [Acetobacteraceae bacterium]|nr:tripartite tricarboxylate transporter substrate binding protein [Acetobacteraceae bacterium]
MKRRHLVVVAAGSGLGLPALSLAQSRWPDRPIRMIVPFPAGGGTDAWARMVAEPLGQELGQPIVVENRSGGSGMIGTDAAAKAPPDGYTLLMNITTHVQSPVVLRRFPYDPLNDFAFIGRLGTTAITFNIGPAVQAQIGSLAEFVAWAKGRPLAFGNYGQGTTGHAFAMLLAQEAGLDVTHVAYRGEGTMVPDFLAGSFHGGFNSTLAAGELFKAGRLRPLATGGPDRVPSMKDRVPTLIELGYSQRFNFSGFTGLFAPARTPPEVLDRLVPAFRKVVTAPDFVARLVATDTIPGYEDPRTFRASTERVMRQWEEMARTLDLFATS